MMRPASSRMTRSASRSTSAMLCEANSSVAPRLSRIILELPPDPVGGVGVERGGRLVEQKQLRRVEQRLGEADAGLLAGRQLAGRAVEQRLDLQILGDIGDALGRVGDAVEAGIDGQVLLDREPRRQIDIGALEIQPMGDRSRGRGSYRRRTPSPRPSSAPPGRAAWRWSWSCRRRCRRAAPPWCPARG